MPRSPLPKDPARISHDQLFKDLFKTFFRELFELFFPDAGKELLFEQVEFLDKELATDRPGGAPRTLDILARVPARDQQVRLVLVHIEIQEREDRDDQGNVLPFNERMARYYMALRLRRPEPILPIVFWFAPGKGAVGMDEYHETLFGEPVLSFRYRRVGVRDLSAEEYLEKGNPLVYGLAARMRRGKLSKPELRRLCLGRVRRAKLSEWQQFLLVNMIMTYVKLNAREEREYRAMLEQVESQDDDEQVGELTWAEEVALRERKKWLAGMVRLISQVYAARFGALPAQWAARLEAVKDFSRLEEIHAALLKASSPAEAEASLTALC